MPFHSTLVTDDDLEQACAAIGDRVRAALGSGPIDLLVVFATPHYGPAIDVLPVLLHDELAPRTLVGCAGAAVLGPGRLLADQPAIAVLAGRLPGAEVAATALTNADLPGPDAAPAAWRRILPAIAAPPRGIALFGDPFQFELRALVAGLDFVWPTAPKIGGLASGSSHPDGSALFHGRQRLRQGAVVLALGGSVAVEAVVAQGCRPIGRTGRITKADRNRLIAVDGRPIRSFVAEQLATVPRDQLAAAGSSPLFLGIAGDPFTTAPPAASDFVVRSVLGMDPQGRFVVSESLGLGRTVQLHLLAPGGGRHDFERLLNQARASEAAGALLFRCVARSGDDHEYLHQAAPGLAVAGATCNGEIGPAGGATQLHTYTAVCGLLREAAVRG